MAHPLYFIRHGETDWNAAGRLQGQKDTPLNDLGRTQAAEAGLKLRGLPNNVDGLPWSASPLTRTMETARLARRAIGFPADGFHIDDRLKEITFGEWESMTWAEVRRHDAAGAKAREADKWSFQPPGGESYAMLRDRIALWLETLTAPLVAVSHGGVARVLLVLLAGMPPREAVDVDIWQGRVLVFEGGTATWV